MRILEINEFKSISDQFKSISDIQGHYWSLYSIGQQQRIVEECQFACIPSLFVKRGKKYGKIEYDFLHTDYRLKDVPLKIIKSLFRSMENISELYHPPKRSYMPGKTYGESKQCEIDICRLISPLISTIIYDTENWEDSPRAWSDKIRY